MRTSVPSWPVALGIDLVAVVVFAVLGRAAHNEALTPGGIAQTAWPFLAGLLIGWLVVRLWRSRYGSAGPWCCWW